MRPQKQAGTLYHCRTKSIVGYNQAGRPAVFPMFCKRWECPDCGPRLAKKARRKLNAGSPTALLTLTSKYGSHATALAAFRALSTAINRLFKRLRRRYPKQAIEYALVWETTQQNWPHVHILLRSGFIPQAFIAECWRQLTGSFIVDIRKIQGQEDAARYVSKYLTKKLCAPYRFKRYRSSLNYGSPPPALKLRDYLSIDYFEQWCASIETTLEELTEKGGWNFEEHWPDLFLPKVEGT